MFHLLCLSLVGSSREMAHPLDDWKPGPPAPLLRPRCLDWTLPSRPPPPVQPHRRPAEASCFLFSKLSCGKFITCQEKYKSQIHSSASSQRVCEQHTNTRNQTPRCKVPAPPSSLLPKDNHYNDFNATDGFVGSGLNSKRFTVLYSLYCIYLTGEPVYCQKFEQWSRTHSGQTSFTLCPQRPVRARKPVLTCSPGNQIRIAAVCRLFFFLLAFWHKWEHCLHTMFVASVPPVLPLLNISSDTSPHCYLDLPCGYQCLTMDV